MGSESCCGTESGGSGQLSVQRGIGSIGMQEQDRDRRTSQDRDDSGYDVCACCAPHVKKTGEIGVIKLTNVQRYKGGVRIRMLCGFRALEDYDKKRLRKEISAELCAKKKYDRRGSPAFERRIRAGKNAGADLERKWLAYRAKEIPQEEDAVCVFEGEHLGGMHLRMLMNLLLEQERICCVVFGGNDTDGYRYVMGSRSIDVRPLAKEMNGYFSGKRRRKAGNGTRGLSWEKRKNCRHGFLRKRGI